MILREFYPRFFLIICLLEVDKQELIVTPRYVCVSSKYERAVFNDGDCMVLVVAVAVKCFSIPSVCMGEGAVTQLPLGFHLAHGRSKERGKLSAVECVVWNYCRVEDHSWSKKKGQIGNDYGWQKTIVKLFDAKFPTFVSRWSRSIIFKFKFKFNLFPTIYIESVWMFEDSIRLRGRCVTASTWIQSDPRPEQGTRQAQSGRMSCLKLL